MNLPRVGLGYDVHQLEPGEAVILGGVTIPFTKRLIGHSDADVICHAIGDALLGAAALGDLGKYFPPSDEKWRGISSLKLLEQIAHLLTRAGYGIGNVDVMVICEEPKLSPHVEAMQSNIAAVLGIAPGAISIKATTNERLGFVGRQEGIAAQAVALIAKTTERNN